MLNRRQSLRDFASASLWVSPTLWALVALCAGTALSWVTIDPHSVLAPLAFQGTADDARALLTTIASTVVTVMALVLGLTVVALQLSSTQFSPRLLRNFLRDRPTQRVLSVYLATFAYSAAGLYTVGVSSGSRTEQFPRLAVSGALVLLFATLGMVVYFADHLAHSIQIDAITGLVQRGTLAVVSTKPGTIEAPPPTPPAWAVVVPAPASGYVQTAHPRLLLPVAAQLGVSVLIRPRVGEHVVAGTTLAWIWSASAESPPPDPAAFRSVIGDAIRVGFERTLEQDAAFGIRQLVDVACKALSPAVNDPHRGSGRGSPVGDLLRSRRAPARRRHRIRRPRPWLRPFRRRRRVQPGRGGFAGEVPRLGAGGRPRGRHTPTRHHRGPSKPAPPGSAPRMQST